MWGGHGQHHAPSQAGQTGRGSHCTMPAWLISSRPSAADPTHRVTTSAAMWSCRKWSRWLSTAGGAGKWQGRACGAALSAWPCTAAEARCIRTMLRRQPCSHTAAAGPSTASAPSQPTHLAVARTGTSCSTPCGGSGTSARSCSAGTGEAARSASQDQYIAAGRCIAALLATAAATAGSKPQPATHMPCSSCSGREARPIICSRSVTG
jgi:hypothetical protein